MKEESAIFSLSLFVRAYFCSNKRGESIKLPFFLRRGLGFFHLGFRFIFFPLSSRLLRRHHSFPHFYTLKKSGSFARVLLSRACSRVRYFEDEDAKTTSIFLFEREKSNARFCVCDRENSKLESIYFYRAGVFGASDEALNRKKK